MGKVANGVLVVFALAACAHTASADPKDVAVAIEQEVRNITNSSRDANALWPGFDPLTVPLAVYDGERTYLFRHPAPPEGFRKLEGVEHDTRIMDGRHEAVTANTSAEIGSVPTATLMIDASANERTPRHLAAVAIHESFHVYQRAHHPDWIANEADLFVYPIDSVELLALRRQETEALRRAIAAETKDDSGCWARQALALRTARYADMAPAFAQYERGNELNEGLAAYVQMRAAERSTIEIPAEGFGPADVRRRAYATGPALAILLDRFDPEWRSAFEDSDGRTLDEALTAALGSGDVCALEKQAVTVAKERAATDVALLEKSRQARLGRFEGKEGWRVIVEAGNEPLWPQGFDPLNVERMDSARVLHTRFLKLGNAAGRMEMLNAEALTTGAGEHPLFQGVRRVELTGLALPDVTEADRNVTIKANGLDLEFAGARLTRDGNTLIVSIGS